MYVMMLYVCLFVFFKQKTAYEMRISDWSSDVCSSDLERCRVGLAQHGVQRGRRGRPCVARAPGARQVHLEDVAGVQVFVDARHAIEELLRRIDRKSVV